MRIVPAPGRHVRDPETLRLVGADGLTIDPNDLYWHRALLDRDVLEASDEAAPDAPSPDVSAIADTGAAEKEPEA